MNLEYDALRDAWKILDMSRDECGYLLKLGLQGIMNAYGVQAGNNIVEQAQKYRNEHFSTGGIVDISLPEGWFKGKPFPESAKPTVDKENHRP